MFGLTGLPTVTARLRTAGGALASEGKAQAMAFTRGASTRFARPRTAFCSWITVRRRPRIAATRAGADG